ncbi:MAG: protein translocase subunit SecF [Deltaproteobacteria bacterium]|nr:protein translocase subunit SecF [Deltaproteobacteria bacterium]
MELFVNSTIDFLGKKKAALVISLILIIVGVVAAVSIPLGKANLGTDFAGGVAIQYRFENPFEMEQVREALKSGGFEDADLQEFSGTTKLLVRVKRAEGNLSALSASIGDVFKTSMASNPYTIDLVNEVGPTIGAKLQKDALWAIAVSLFGILLYVAWRFEFRFGVSAVCATFHDVLAVLGILFILDKEINLLIVTALLTVAGYSLTDTVVVFDRIRENLRVRNKEDLTPLINRSVNEVLSRTIVTSGTTLIVLVALIVLGGEVIHDFAVTLAFGVVVGTYSSIFVASPLLLLWKKGGKLIKE